MIATPVVLLLLLGTAPPATAPQDCGGWQECRDKALAAAASGDYERFHDLAWRAVQKGPRNDPSLMTILARAQSLSGRPHDALVMLQRLAAMGVVTDAAESEDFRRVRALSGWAQLAPRLAAAATPAAEPEPKVESKREPPPSPANRAAPPKPEPEPAPPAAHAGPPTRKASEETVVGAAADALRFTTEPFLPAGLVYDSVSSRFIVAHRRDRKLSVIGEQSSRVSNLIGAESGGFGEIGALALDARQGDLWVASADGDKGAMLHKLQLISGRLLFTESPEPDALPARFEDLMVTGAGTVFALDTLGRRVFRLPGGVPRGGALEPVATLEDDPVSIAPASDSIVYVAEADGITRIDLPSKQAHALTAGASVRLGGFTWIRAHEGSLIGVQQGAADRFHIVRLRLNPAGTTVTRAELLEKDIELSSPAAAAIAGNVLFYLAPAGRVPGREFRVRRITLR